MNKKVGFLIAILLGLVFFNGQVEAQGENPANNSEWCQAAGQAEDCTPPHEAGEEPQVGGPYPFTPPAEWRCTRWFGLADDDVTQFLVDSGWPQPIDIGSYPGTNLDQKVNYMLDNEGPFGPGDLLLVWWWSSPFYNAWNFQTVLRLHNEFVIPGGRVVVTLEYAGFVASPRPNYMLGILGSTLQLDMTRYVVHESARLIPPWNQTQWFYNQKTDQTDSFAISLATGDLINPTNGQNTRAMYYSPTESLVVVGEQTVGAGIVRVDADSSRTDDLALWYYGRDHADQYEYVARRHSCAVNPGDPIEPDPTVVKLASFEASSHNGWVWLVLLVPLLCVVTLRLRRA